MGLNVNLFIADNKSVCGSLKYFGKHVQSQGRCSDIPFHSPSTVILHLTLFVLYRGILSDTWYILLTYIFLNITVWKSNQEIFYKFRGKSLDIFAVNVFRCCFCFLCILYTWLLQCFWDCTQHSYILKGQMCIHMI